MSMRPIRYKLMQASLWQCNEAGLSPGRGPEHNGMMDGGTQGGHQAWAREGALHWAAHVGAQPEGA